MRLDVDMHKRSLYIIASIFALCITATLMSACTNTSPQQSNQSVQAQIKDNPADTVEKEERIARAAIEGDIKIFNGQFQNMSDESILSYLGEDAADALDFYRTYFQTISLTYDESDIKILATTATANVTLNAKSLNDWSTNLDTRLTTAQSDGTFSGISDEAALQAKQKEIMLDELNKLPIKQSSNKIQLNYSKVNGSWELADESFQTQFEEALTSL